MVSSLDVEANCKKELQIEYDGGNGNKNKIRCRNGDIIPNKLSLFFERLSLLELPDEVIKMAIDAHGFYRFLIMASDWDKTCPWGENEGMGRGDISPDHAKQIRQSLNLTTRDMALALGLEGKHAWRTVLRYERGERNIKGGILTAYKFLEKYGVEE